MTVHINNLRMVRYPCNSSTVWSFLRKSYIAIHFLSLVSWIRQNYFIKYRIYSLCFNSKSKCFWLLTVQALPYCFNVNRYIFTFNRTHNITIFINNRLSIRYFPCNSSTRNTWRERYIGFNIIHCRIIFQHTSINVCGNICIQIYILYLTCNLFVIKCIIIYLKFSDCSCK